MHKLYRIYSFTNLTSGWGDAGDVDYIIAKSEEEVKIALRKKYGSYERLGFGFMEVGLEELRGRILELEIQIAKDREMLELMKWSEVQIE